MGLMGELIDGYEDLLEITENNIDGPDFGDYELKAMRTNTQSMLTLFTKAPEPDGINNYLLQTYGYSSDNYSNDHKVLHSTLDAAHFAPISNTGKSLIINCTNERIEIMDRDRKVSAYWTEETLKKAFLKKYKYCLVHCFADSSGSDDDESFKFHTACELYDFNFENFIALLHESLILIDIRIGQYPDGSAHDHGTGFRIKEQNLPKLFKTKNILVEGN